MPAETVERHFSWGMYCVFASFSNLFNVEKETEKEWDRFVFVCPACVFLANALFLKNAFAVAGAVGGKLLWKNRILSKQNGKGENFSTAPHFCLSTSKTAPVKRETPVLCG